MTKFFLTSKTLIGAAIMLAGAYGYTLPFTGEEASEILVQAEKLLGLVLVIWGRWTAEKPLGFSL